MQKLVATLGADQCRFVGGVVRDSLLGKGIEDFDVATTHKPEEAQRLLEAKKIKVIPTGLKYGTVTAVVDGQPFEVTTLRVDVKTLGRHAEVAFHDNWQEDARRRDFTINAIYLAPDNTLYDYFGGEGDLREGRVRFIGNPINRIKEDALRILRFFRFQAWFGKGNLDADGLEACRKSIELLDILSAERVRQELFKILLAENPLPVLKEMKKIGIFRQIFGKIGVDISALENLIAVENILRKRSALRRLAAILPVDANELSDRLKLSNNEAKRLSAMQASLPETLEDPDIRRVIYQDGKEAFEDKLLMRGGDISKIKTHLKTAAGFEIPAFPVRGADLEKLGVKPGKAMGDILKRLEQEWIENDFRLSKKELLKT